MALTGRAALLALLAVVPVALAPGGTVLVLLAVLLLVAVVVDIALAGPVSSLEVARDGDVSCRLGSTAQVRLSLVNRGSRRVRGLVRDAWVPSAGAVQGVQALDVPAGERRVLTTVLVPTRRGDRTPDRVTIRSVGPLGLAARQGRHEVPWRLRVQPPFASRRFLP